MPKALDRHQFIAQKYPSKSIKSNVKFDKCSQILLQTTFGSIGSYKNVATLIQFDV